MHTNINGDGAVSVPPIYREPEPQDAEAPASGRDIIQDAPDLLIDDGFREKSNSSTINLIQKDESSVSAKMFPRDPGPPGLRISPVNFDSPLVNDSRGATFQFTAPPVQPRPRSREPGTIRLVRRSKQEFSHNLGEGLRNSHPVPLAGPRFGSTEYLFGDTRTRPVRRRLVRKMGWSQD
jgi:hypothetical protein